MTNPSDQVLEARETYIALSEISKLLLTDLDPESLALCVRLIEAGVNPDALASVLREFKNEISHLDENGDNSTNHIT